MKIQTENGIKEVLKLLESGDPVHAQQNINQLFMQELDSRELSFTNRCCTFWIDIKKRLSKISDPYERSMKCLPEWKSFQQFLVRERFVYKPAFDAMQIGYFSVALKQFTSLLEERDSNKKLEIYRNAGICYKKLGNYNDARTCFSEAFNLNNSDASILAELADCYALCGEDRKSKILFREAFYIDPESIDVDLLDCELIKSLIKETVKKGYKGKALLYWIPVYGILRGIFVYKLQLLPQDVRSLNNSVYALENELKDPNCRDAEILLPRLLNSYFRLLDFYKTDADMNQRKIAEILTSMRFHAPSIYEDFMGKRS